MKTFSHRNGLNLGIGIGMIAFAFAAGAQDKGSMPGSAVRQAIPAATAPSVNASPAISPPVKRRMVKRNARAKCQLLDDPWGDLCVVRKKAETACRDLAVGGVKVKAARNGRNRSMAPIAGSPRRDCVDAYMRNV